MSSELTLNIFNSPKPSRYLLYSAVVSSYCILLDDNFHNFVSHHSLTINTQELVVYKNAIFS